MLGVPEAQERRPDPEQPELQLRSALGRARTTPSVERSISRQYSSPRRFAPAAEHSTTGAGNLMR